MHFSDWTDFIIDNSLVNKPNKYGLTPIFFCNNILSFLRLLSNGADLNYCDCKGNNAMFYNYITDKNVIIKFIEHGVNLNKVNSNGFSLFNYQLFNLYPELFLSYRELFKLEDVFIDRIYINSYSNLKKLIDYGFFIKVLGDVKVEFSLNNVFSKNELTKTLNLIKANHR